MSWLTASWEMMLGEKSEMKFGGHFVALIVMMGASSGGTAACRRGDRRAAGRPKLKTCAGLTVTGTAPGVLLHVFCPWVRGAAL